MLILPPVSRPPLPQRGRREGRELTLKHRAREMRNMGRLSVAAALALCTLAALPAGAQPQDLMTFMPMDVSDNIPVGEITTLHQDRRGFIWIGSGNGLYRYDGYHVQRYRNSRLFPHLLPSNEITCLRDDADGRLWVGTRQGLCRLDLRSGMSRTYHFRDFENSNALKCLLVTRDSGLWAGTEGGLYRYDAPTDSFTLYCDKNGNAKVPHASITSLLEDRQGYVWVGTWDKGLYRYNPDDGTFYEMPDFNALHSAQAVYEDNGALWVGTWGKGLYKIENPYDTNVPLVFASYTRAGTSGQLASDIIWQIGRDRSTGLLWVGTDCGLSFVAEADDRSCRIVAAPEAMSPAPDYFGRGVGCFLSDRDQQMWAYATQRGIVVSQSKSSLFARHELPAPYLYSDYITCVENTPDGSVWAGLRSNGVLVFSNGGFRQIPMPSQVNAVCHLSPSATLVGTERDGIAVVEDGRVVRWLDRANAPYLVDNCIYKITPDRHGNWLVGTWRGLSVRYADGRGAHVEGKLLDVLCNAKVKDITCARDGSIWMATRGDGILRLQGDIRHPSAMKLRQYARLDDSQLDLRHVYRILIDRRDRVWACSKEAGLLVYDAALDRMVSASHRYGIPDEDVYSIEESAWGDLWISMRNELMCLTINDSNHVSGMHSYLRRATIGDNLFGNALSSANSSRFITFGYNNGFVSFPNKRQHGGGRSARPTITDIQVAGRSLFQMDTDARLAISPLLPPYATEVTLPPTQHELLLCFSSLNYNKMENPRFAYKLDGCDKDWHYPDASLCQAAYSNLPYGTYTFRLRCTDEGGSWSADEQTLRVTVLAPFYLRWYALLCYALLLAGAAFLVVRYVKNRNENRRQLQLAHIERRNIEQLNHKKLQFFTNITHDLMTPLTVISATVSHLMQLCPEQKESLRTIDGSVNRLMRLLQQILEFRKTETGNQHLRVSQGVLSDFVRSEVESIRPATYKNRIRFSLECRPERVEGFFDSDKLDKIIYNLISNAIKYNRPDGSVRVSLTCDDGLRAVIRVEDDGAGIAADKIPTLFQRFYEGEHRKFNTYGMGIGLSLVKDLVTLHHGTIEVESELGKGSAFTVTIPIAREAFGEEEIEDSSQMVIDGASRDASEPEPAGRRGAATVLVVEDDDDLLVMLRKLLGQSYNVVTAYNGREALEVLDNEAVALVLTDVMMPVMDGVELTRQLRGRKDIANCPVIMLTAKHDDEARAEAYKAGADAYITKPFNTSVLLARIQNLLQQRRNTDAEVSEKLFGGIKDMKLGTTDQDFLNACIRAVQQHIADADFDLPMFARVMNASKSTLYKKLRALTGLNTSAFIRSVRMKSACELLRNNPKAHISDVAYAVGYNDPKYFSSCFKKDFGCLPSEYVASLKDG